MSATIIVTLTKNNKKYCQLRLMFFSWLTAFVIISSCYSIHHDTRRSKSLVFSLPYKDFLIIERENWNFVHLILLQRQMIWSHVSLFIALHSGYTQDTWRFLNSWNSFNVRMFWLPLIILSVPVFDFTSCQLERIGFRCCFLQSVARVARHFRWNISTLIPTWLW